MVKEHGTEALQKLVTIFHELSQVYDPFENFDLDVFYGDKGVFTVPGYRGLGVAEQFFKSRRIICKAHAVPMTGAWMTSLGSQKAAARDGWQTVSEVKFQDLAVKYGISFTDVAPTVKYMIARISEVK